MASSRAQKRLSPYTRIAGFIALLPALFWLGLAGDNPAAAAAARPHRLVALTGASAPPFPAVLQGINNLLAARQVAAAITTIHLDQEGATSDTALREALAGKPEVIVCLGSAACENPLVRAAGVPVVYGMIFKPEAPPAPAGLFTGVSLDFAIDTELELLAQFIPHTRNVGVLYNPAENSRKIAQAQNIAEKLGLNLIAVPVNTLKDLPLALTRILLDASVIWGINDPVVLSPQTANNVLLHSFRNRIPFVGLSEAWVKAGALYALDRDYEDIGAQCGELIVEILAGTRPSRGNVFPRKILYYLNMKTAKHMKLDFPAAIIDGAAKIY